jgi:cytidylate kinase
MNPKSTSERMADAMTQARQHWQTRLAREPLDVEAVPPPPLTIAVSREAGANGPAIAREVAKRLGWPVYDRELLERIAADMGVRTSLLGSVDEKRASWLAECLQVFGSRPAVSQVAYVRHLAEVLLHLAAHGNCVIVGRGATAVLPAATTLRVRLIGPRDERITAIQQRFGVTEAEAARWVDTADRDRARFVREHFQKDTADPRHYDLVLNAMRLPVPACAAVIVEGLHGFQHALADKGAEETSVCR